MERTDVRTIVSKLRDEHARGALRDTEERVEILRRLHDAVRRYETDIAEALAADLHKAEYETYLTETGLILRELSLHIRKLRRWMRPRHAGPSLAVFPSSGRIIYEPLGVVLIIAPWNYPLQLLFMPLIAALSAGNCVVLKPSPAAPRTAAVMKRIIDELFEGSRAVLVEDAPGIMEELLEERFDHIFFTGGSDFGRTIALAAARHLTPTTLELGGKCPCIVGREADIAVTARRIVWGKILNAGQTCVAPDYILVERSVKDRLIAALKSETIAQLGPNPRLSSDYPRIVNSEAMKRLNDMLESCRGRIVWGGEVDMAERYVSPTIIDSPDPRSRLMSEEIFGPLLPVLPYDELSEALSFVNGREKPLALYYFGSHSQARKAVRGTTSGSVGINDTVMQLAHANLPFGGVGASGTGRYHGRYGFERFSNERAVLSTPTCLDIPMRYAPYKQSVLRFVKLILR